jgi:hypoxanthine phosphoribosyltransferase
MTKEWIELLNATEIDQYVEKCAERLNSEFLDGVRVPPNIIMVCILDSAIHFYSDLIRKLTFSFKTEFINSDEEQFDFSRFKGASVVLVDILCDTGTTFNRFKALIKPHEPKFIYKMSLLVTDIDVAIEVLDYFAVHVKDTRMVGYGLDDNGFKRGLNGLFGCPKNSHDQNLEVYKETAILYDIEYDSLKYRESNK